MVINSFAQLEPQLFDALATGRTVPLMVLRPADVEQRLEAQMIEAFAHAAERVVREGDRLVHEPGSDWFAIALLAPARDGTSALMLDARSALERISAMMSFATGRRMESGWWPITTLADVAAFGATIERALERGARERERNEFLATVGHELRTPLTSIRGYIETLLDDDLDVATTRRFLEVARSEALRLGRLIDGMLDFSPLDLSQRPPAGVTNLAAATETAIDVLAPIARAAGMALEVRCEGEATVRINGDACMHVLLNVIENAIKYASPGGHVLISLERRDPFICAIIEDDGPGVPVAERERIFEHRTRGGRSAARPGSGIGLAIVRTIVERAAGSVHVDDARLGGARFVIRFPAAKADFYPSLS